MAQTATPVDNGVNVQALLDAREALTGAPQAAQFKWRATSKWVNGTHSASTVKSFFGLGEEQKPQDRVQLRRRPSRDLRVRRQRHDPGRVRARRPGELPDRRHRRSRAEP